MQPSPPRDAGRTLFLHVSTSCPEGCRNMAHVSRHRVRIKAAQPFPALAFFEPVIWREEEQRAPDPLSLSRGSADWAPHLPVLGCQEHPLTPPHPNRAGMGVVVPSSCLPTSAGSARMGTKLHACSPQPGSSPACWSWVGDADGGPLRGLGAACLQPVLPMLLVLPAGGPPSLAEHQPAPVQSALLDTGGNWERCGRTGGTGAGP